MALIQLAGYVAYIVAAGILGARLIWLWRRTREWPELAIGASFLLAGFVGYAAWLVIGVLRGGGATPETIKQVAQIGLALTIAGAQCNGVGTLLIFRPGAKWAKALLAIAGVLMATCWARYFGSVAGESAPQFWLGILSIVPLYAWAAVESLSLGSLLRKRARLGLADPLVVNRMTQYGVSGAAVVASIAVSYTSQLVYGIAPPPWTAALASGLLVVGAASIWLGFFPPASVRARLLARAGG